MWIKKIGKYGLGVVLRPLGAVSGVIQDENVSDLGQVTFSMVLSTCVPIYTIFAKLLFWDCFTASYHPKGLFQG